jgi:hypothetical protein
MGGVAKKQITELGGENNFCRVTYKALVEIGHFFIGKKS